MDPAKLIQLLKSTTDPANRENAEAQLKQVSHVLFHGFGDICRCLDMRTSI